MSTKLRIKLGGASFGSKKVSKSKLRVKQKRRIEEVSDDSDSDFDVKKDSSSLPSRYRHLRDISEEEESLLKRYSEQKEAKKRVDQKGGVANKVLEAARNAQAAEQKRRLEKFGIKVSDGKSSVNKIRLKAPGAGGSANEHGRLSKRPRIPGEENSSSVYEDGFDSSKGSYLLRGDWKTVDHSDPLTFNLPNLNFTGEGRVGNSGNTLIVSATMPKESKRFCFNICPTTRYKESDPETEIYYHFNPRDGWGKQLIIQNSFRNGKWDQRKQSIYDFPITKGKKFEIRVTMKERGFCIYMDGVLLTEYYHRFKDGCLKASEYIYLIVPVLEEHYGDKENVIIHSIWWGYMKSDPKLLAETRTTTPDGPPLLPQGRKGLPLRPGHKFKKGARPSKRMHEYEPLTLHVSGLPKDETAKEELLRLFDHYGIARLPNGELDARVIDGKGRGFVKLSEQKSVVEAIQFLNGAPGRTEERLKVTKAWKSSS